MNLVQCSSDCLYQKDGICAIGSTSLQVRHTGATNDGGCIYFAKSHQPKSAIKNAEADKKT